MLNLTQRHILKTFFDDLFDELVFCGLCSVLRPSDVITILQAVLDCQTATVDALLLQIGNTDLSDVVKQLQDILRHECPQNRTASSVKVPENKQGLDLGFVYFRAENGGQLLREKRGLFGLTARNDATCQAVERTDVVYFVRERIEQERSRQSARQLVFDEMDALLAAATKKQTQEFEIQKKMEQIDVCMVSGNASEAIKLTRDMDSGLQQQVEQRTTKQIQNGQYALARRAVLHHVRGQHADAAWYLERLQSTGNSELIQVTNSLADEFRVSRFLGSEITQIDVTELSSFVEQLPVGHESRLKLVLLLAEAHEAGGNVADASSALRKVSDALSPDIPNSDLDAVLEKMLQQSPVEPLAGYHWLKQRKQRKGVLHKEHENIAFRAISSNLDVVLRCDALKVFTELWAEQLYHSAALQVTDILQSSKTVSSDILLDIASALVDNTYVDIGTKFAQKVLKRMDAGRARALFILSRAYGATDRLKNLHEAMDLGYSKSECLALMASQFDLDRKHSEAETAAMQALELAETDHQVVHALLSAPYVTQDLNKIASLFTLNADRAKRQRLAVAIEYWRKHVVLLVQTGQLATAEALARETKCLLYKTGSERSFRYDIESVYRHCWEAFLGAGDFAAGLRLLRELQSLECCADMDISRFCNIVCLLPHRVPENLRDIEELARKYMSDYEGFYGEDTPRICLARVLLEKGQLDEGMKHISVALHFIDTVRTSDYIRAGQPIPVTLTAFRVTCLILRGALNHRRGSNNNARRDFNEALKSIHSCGDKLLLEDIALLCSEFGELLLKQGNPAQAISLIESSGNEHFLGAPAHRVKAKCYISLYKETKDKKHVTRAIDCLARVTGVSVGCTKADWVFMSELLILEGNYDGARYHLKQCEQTEEVKVALIKATLREADIRITWDSELDKRVLKSKLQEARACAQDLLEQKCPHSKKLLKEIDALLPRVSQASVAATTRP